MNSKNHEKDKGKSPEKKSKKINTDSSSEQLNDSSSSSSSNSISISNNQSLFSSKQAELIVMPMAVIVTGKKPEHPGDPIKIIVVGPKSGQQKEFIMNLIGNNNFKDRVTSYTNNNFAFTIKYSMSSPKRAAKNFRFKEDSIILIMDDVNDFRDNYINSIFNLVYNPKLFILTYLRNELEKHELKNFIDKISDLPKPQKKTKEQALKLSKELLEDLKNIVLEEPINTLLKKS